MCEIDRRVCEVSQEFLPSIGGWLQDPRVELVFADGIRYVMERKDEFDVIIVDAPDPEGPAVGLFEGSFYQSVQQALKDGGVFSAQSESPFHNAQLLGKIYRNVEKHFPVTRCYLAFIPTYQSGMWSFILGSKVHDPLGPIRVDAQVNTRYYTEALHKTCFELPRFVQEILQ